MYSRLFPVLAFTLFEVFTVSYGLPRSSTSAILQRNSNLLSRQSFSCSCSSSATACSACGGTCCTAGDVCFTDPTGQQHTFSQEACCTGASCAGASPSSSSSASQPASTSTPSTSSPTPTSTPPPSSASVQNPEPSSTTAPASTTAAPPPPVKTTKTGAIVGGAVGGAAAVGGLAGILAFFTTQQGWYVLGSLAAALFGLFLFKSRRLVFSVDDDIGPTQISLFLTSHPKLIDTASADPQKLLVWKVFDIGHTQRQFDVTVPCVYKQGSPKIGFGTIDDDESRVKCVNFSPGPAYLDSEGVWHIDEDKPVDAHRPAFARNDSEKASRIAVGTLDDSGDTMEPFLLIEDTEFGNGSEYNAASDLYLHVFRSVGYSAGKYKDTIVKDIEGDRLTPIDGIKVKSLRPLTSWRIRSAGEGRLKLEIMANRKDDVKKYRHDCTIKKAAKHNGD